MRPALLLAHLPFLLSQTTRNRRLQPHLQWVQLTVLWVAWYKRAAIDTRFALHLELFSIVAFSCRFRKIRYNFFPFMGR